MALPQWRRRNRLLLTTSYCMEVRAIGGLETAAGFYGQEYDLRPLISNDYSSFDHLD